MLAIVRLYLDHINGQWNTKSSFLKRHTSPVWDVLLLQRILLSCCGGINQHVAVGKFVLTAEQV